jgi:hypothetical protein
MVDKFPEKNGKNIDRARYSGCSRHSERAVRESTKITIRKVDRRIRNKEGGIYEEEEDRSHQGGQRAREPRATLREKHTHQSLRVL